MKEVNTGPEWKDDDEKEFVSGIDTIGKRKKGKQQMNPIRRD